MLILAPSLILNHEAVRCKRVTLARVYRRICCVERGFLLN
jgi:hypothetical protein